MKKVVIGVLVVVVVCVGFYLGYRQAKMPEKEKVSLKSYSTPSEPIQFSYDTNIRVKQNYLYSVGFDNYKDSKQIKNNTLEGKIDVYHLFLQILGAPENPSELLKLENDQVLVDSPLQNKYYQINLKFPLKEPRINVINKVSLAIGLEFQEEDTTYSVTRITWKNGMDIEFPTTMIPLQVGQANLNGTMVNFADFEEIDIPKMMEKWEKDKNYSSKEEAIKIMKENQVLDIKPLKVKFAKWKVWEKGSGGYHEPPEVKIDGNHIESPSSFSGQKIEFDYVPTTFLNPSTQNALSLSGVSFGTLESILGQCIHPEWDTLVVGSPYGSQYYKFILKYPYREPRENIVKLLSTEFGFTYQTQEISIPYYQATWNGQKFSVPTSETKPQIGMAMNYRNNSINELFDFYNTNEKAFQIKNDTGMGDAERFHGIVYWPPRDWDMDRKIEYLNKEWGTKFGITLTPMTPKIERQLIIRPASS